MGLFDPRCKTCGNRTQKACLSEEMCPACCEKIALFNAYNKEYQEKTGKTFTDTIDAVVKMDKETMQRGFYKLLADNTPSCKACGETFSFSDLKEGYCAECYATLEAYLDIRDMFQKMTGKKLALDPKAVVKMTEADMRQALSDLIRGEKPEPKTPDYIFSHLYERPSLELMLEYGVIRAKYVTKGNEDVCVDCRKRNGLILPVAEAIELGLHNSDLHKECGWWVPLRERDPNEDPDAWKKGTIWEVKS